MVSTAQSLRRAAPGLESHNARTKVGYAKGHLEKQLSGEGLVPSPEGHNWWHMRARPGMALDVPGPRQGTGHICHLPPAHVCFPEPFIPLRDEEHPAAPHCSPPGD